MNQKSVLITIVSLVVIFIFLFAVYSLINKTPDYSEILKVSKQDHVKWSLDQKHVLYEYSDLQCPACAVFHESLSTYEATGSAHHEITKKATLVFRHFPLYQNHENAFEIAYAAEAAGKQGKFFDMISSLFADQRQLTNASNTRMFLTEKARSIGLDTKKFLKDMESPDIQAKVQADLAGGEKMGINATPTFFLDGQKLEIQNPQQLLDVLKDLD